MPRFAWGDPRALAKGAPSDQVRARELLSFAIPMRLGDEPLQVRGVVSWTPRAPDVRASAEPPQLPER